jgi:hypothetical protein
VGISAEKSVLTEQESAVGLERKWIGQELKKSIYTLYYANIYLTESEKFLIEEKQFLEKLIANYDAKSEENKNRYLVYNQARIIVENIKEGLNATLKEKEKILESLKYLCGWS